MLNISTKPYIRLEKQDSVKETWFRFEHQKMIWCAPCLQTADRLDQAQHRRNECVALQKCGRGSPDAD
jgi:hypothetical protein